MNKIVLFDEPPSDSRRPYAEFWQTLKDNPGKWAIYPGKYMNHMPPRGFEKVQREGKSYVRWVV